MTQNPYQPPPLAPAGKYVRLSSKTTPLLGYATLGVAAVLALVLLNSLTVGRLPWGRANPPNLEMVIFLVGSLIAATMLFQRKTVLAGEEHFVLGSERSDIIYYFRDIREIRVYKQFYFEVVLRLKSDSAADSKVVFVFPLRLANRIENQPEFQLLREKCPHLRHKTRHRNLKAEYLKLTRPPKLDTSWDKTE